MKKLILTILIVFLPLMGWAIIFQTVPAALQEAFPAGTTIKRKTLFLDKKQKQALSDLIGQELDSRLIVYYEGHLKGKVIASAFIDSHRVRTQKEAVLFVVSNKQKIIQIKQLQFLEPRDYLAPKRWLSQFLGKTLSDKLSLRQEIHGITGATLTASAMTMAARRVLALHHFIYANKAIAAGL